MFCVKYATIGIKDSVFVGDTILSKNITIMPIFVLWRCPRNTIPL